jgi:hypothetical protein
MKRGPNSPLPPHPDEPGGIPLIFASQLGEYIARENARLMERWLARGKVEERWLELRRELKP